MKKDLHPKLNRVCFEDVSTKKQFLTWSTMNSDKTATIEGEEYFVVPRDITMDSHPVYTGEKRFVDTAGRVEKFQKKFGRKSS
ncbi:MAG: type B 50S ribosomal protein L31 [Opitutae bacterium]|jgi:large subunit ribosomal protein L31|nr:type B 50S ribosomal protein L31 [Opitutae bacterium]MBT4223594.1 type B 50S ribosomal protein L31 [Opitutae bacterium]MBT5379976.1 type B 50S ribosomal protein L31 [Opitutae bacterium]MBT5690812.1 type B 50S ribosomal protein L31 [Opitutae bacterium]MBT6464016.1 type B 50S ribosomal protein L31 [Opitutae bacterium]